MTIACTAAAALLAGCAQVEHMQSVLHPSGIDALVISDIAWLLFGGGALIFVGVMALLLLSLRNGRRAVSTTTWIIGAGVLFPFVVLTSLLFYSIHRSHQLTPPVSQDALVVSVTAHMWWWEVRYRDEQTGRDVMLANEIRIPVGRPVYFALTSADVIHSFWAPTLAGKVDMLPGRLTRLRVQASETGVFRGQCAEYCGEQHARMAMHIVVQPQAEFDAWLSAQARPAVGADNELLIRGRQVFLDQRCSACHTIRGVAEERLAGQQLGPDLTHVGSRLYIGAGIVQNDRAALGAWIRNTQHLKPGARMPSFSDIDDDDLFALSSYLEHLQ